MPIGKRGKDNYFTSPRKGGRKFLSLCPEQNKITQRPICTCQSVKVSRSFCWLFPGEPGEGLSATDQAADILLTVMTRF